MVRIRRTIINPLSEMFQSPLNTMNTKTTDMKNCIRLGSIFLADPKSKLEKNATRNFPFNPFQHSLLVTQLMIEQDKLNKAFLLF